MNTAAVSMLCFIITMSVVTPAMVASAAGDVTAPITNASVSGTIGANGWYITNASVNLTATDDMSGVANISYKLDNNGWINYTGNLTVTDGRHLIQYNSTDNDSNVEANVSHKLFINVDTMAPHTILSISGTKGNNGWYFSPITVSLAASDSTSLPAITWYNLNDGTGWKTYSGSFNLSNNPYTVSYQSVDNAGNLEASQSTIININPGLNKPVTTALLSGTQDVSGWYVSNVTVTFTATGGTGGINHTEYSFDGKTWITGNSLIVTAEGYTKILFRSVDNAGNVEDNANNILWVPIDKSGPVISCSLGGDRNAGMGWYNGDVTVTLTASDNGGSGINLTQYSLDGAHWVNYTGPFKFGWGPSRTFFYRATDNLSRNTYGSQFVYFRPQNMDEGPMSDQIYTYGYGPSLSSPTATPSPTPRPTITPTPAPEPTSTPLPSVVGPSPSGPAPAGSANTGLAMGVLLVVLAMLVAGCLAIYYLVFKPK